MFHFVAHAFDDGLLFRTWEEAHALWVRLLRAFGQPLGMFLMPNHLHVLHSRDVSRELAAAMSAYARWRNHHRGKRGRVWRAAPPVQRVLPGKQRRMRKYVRLQACRDGFTRFPLQWPFSTYRDEVGLAVPLVRPADPDPYTLHTRTCADDAVTRTDLPSSRGEVLRGTDGVVAVADAVSALARAPRAHLQRRGPHRALVLRCARILCDASHAEIADVVGVKRGAVLRAPRVLDPQVRMVERVVGDRRFGPLHDGDLREGWPRWYAERR